jgi:hypothetical protein
VSGGGDLRVRARAAGGERKRTWEEAEFEVKAQLVKEAVPP